MSKKNGKSYINSIVTIIVRKIRWFFFLALLILNEVKLGRFMRESFQHFKTFFSLQVSWIRKRDVVVLTHGQLVFTSDERVKVGNPVAFELSLDSIYLCRKYIKVRTLSKVSKIFLVNLMASEVDCGKTKFWNLCSFRIPNLDVKHNNN